MPASDARGALLNLIDNYYDSEEEPDGDPVIFVPHWFPEHCLNDVDREEGDNVIFERNGTVPFEFHVHDRDREDVVSLSFNTGDGEVYWRVAVHRPSVLAMKDSLGDG